MGTAAAFSKSAANSWRRKVARDQAPKRRLSDAQLEQAVMRIAHEFPEHVVYGAAT